MLETLGDAASALYKKQNVRARKNCAESVTHTTDMTRKRRESSDNNQSTKQPRVGENKSITRTEGRMNENDEVEPRP